MCYAIMRHIIVGLNVGGVASLGGRLNAILFIAVIHLPDSTVRGVLAPKSSSTRPHQGVSQAMTGYSCIHFNCFLVTP